MIFGLWNWALHFKGCHKLKPSGVHRVPTGTREVNRPIYPLWLSFTYSLEQHWFMSYALEYSCYWTWPSRNSGFAHWKWWLSIYIYIHINWEVEPLNTSNHQGSDSWQPYFLWGVAPLTLLTKTSQGVAAPLVLVLCLKIMGNRATDSLLKIRDLRITSNEGVFRFRRNEIISVHKWSAFGMPLMIFPAEKMMFLWILWTIQ